MLSRRYRPVDYFDPRHSEGFYERMAKINPKARREIHEMVCVAFDELDAREREIQALTELWPISVKKKRWFQRG